ncbi:NAD(P)/FAD-dependent oxidoreductase [Catenuloplanes japonicus]|uniref:hypothetical protein n=1 Tax=Catenuloplanes japonicus TaxID=33876 RepID=UPI00068DEC72|nr:hypothetical protein [Catenuloplanes japonicus]
MSHSPAEVDYLVIGAGASGMAFTDALIGGTDHSVLIVDRRHASGGHWNDTYPFVRLHQPSAYYGVGSRNLGADRIDETGMYERATGLEVLGYFQAVMEEHFLPSGQVTFAPMSDCRVDGERVSVVSRLTSTVREVTVRRSIVDARYAEGAIPATHRRSFAVDDDARCIPINDLVHADGTANGYVVLGGGKTAMDACLWLLGHGVDPDVITWVRPRDPWIMPRETVQARDQVGSYLISYAASVEASADATSAADLFARLESCGHLTRLDPGYEPAVFRGATVSVPEIEMLRRITRVVRGRVRRIARDRIVLDDREVRVHGRPLHIDCTASALATPDPRPVFEAGRITIQPVQASSLSFNAALIGYIESTREDTAEKNTLSPPSRYPITADDWIRSRRDTMLAHTRWLQAPDVQRWVQHSRLNIASGIRAHVAEPGVAEALHTVRTRSAPALENLAKLSNPQEAVKDDGGSPSRSEARLSRS